MCSHRTLGVRSRIRPCHKPTKYPVFSFFSRWDYLIYYRNNNCNNNEAETAVIMVVDMVYSSKIAVRESTLIFTSLLRESNPRGQSRHLINSVCLWVGTLEGYSRITRGFECDDRMLNASSARSAAHLAQGLSQLGLIQLGISIQVPPVHRLCLSSPILLFFLGRGAQARNKASVF